MEIKFTIKKAWLGLNLSRLGQLPRETFEPIIFFSEVFQTSDFSSIFFSNNRTKKDFKKNLRGRGIIARHPGIYALYVFLKRQAQWDQYG